MKILFAAPENAWGGFLNLIQSAVPEHEFKYNVMATPHIGGSTDNAMKGIVAQVAANIRRVADNKEPLHQFGA